MEDLEKYYRVQQAMPLVTVPEWVVSNEYDILNDRFVDSGHGQGCNEVDLWNDSFIIAPVGPRGSGKTTLASALAIKSVWLWPELRVIANYPLKWAIRDGKGKSVVHLSEPLDLVKMVNFDTDYMHVLIILDESPAIINRMAAATNKNRVLNLWIQQIRKNRNSLIMCSQDFRLIDYEAQYQTDIIAYCRDASRRYPRSGVKRGGVILLDFIDHSGLWTGYTSRERPRPLRKRLNAEYIWGTFDTYFQLDILAQMWRLEIQKDKVVAGGGAAQGVSDIDYLLKADILFEEAKQAGKHSVECGEIFKAIGADETMKQDIGRRMGKIGCGRDRLGSNLWNYPLQFYSSEEFLQIGGQKG